MQQGRIRVLLVLGAVALLGSMVGAQQAPPAKNAGARRPAPARGGSGTAATVQEIMDLLIGPGSQVVFDAVKSESTSAGAVEKAPKDDLEWKNVRDNALLMIEGANLLLMPGRHIATGSADRGASRAPNDAGELAMAEIEVRVARNRAVWNRLTSQFRSAAMVALRAAEAKDPRAVQASGGNIDTTCENCHLRFWYPDQEKVLEKAGKAAQAAKTGKTP